MWPGQDNILYLFQIFQSFMDSMLDAKPSHVPEANLISALDILIKLFPRVWVALWEVRVSLLEAATTTIRDGSNDVFYVEIVGIASTMVDVLLLFRYVMAHFLKGLSHFSSRPDALDVYNRPESRMRQLLLLGWVHSKVPATRQRILESFLSLAYDSTISADTSGVVAVLRDVIDSNDSWLDAALKTIIKDTRHGTLADRGLHNLAVAASWLAPLKAGKDQVVLRGEPMSMDRRVAWALFAACRRQLCIGTSDEWPKPGAWLAAVWLASSYWCVDPLCNARCAVELTQMLCSDAVEPKDTKRWVEIEIHALIEHVATSLLPSMGSEEMTCRSFRSHTDPCSPSKTVAQWPAYLLAWCRDVLVHAYSSERRLKRETLFLRRRSWTAWSSSRDHLKAKGYVNEYGNRIKACAVVHEWLQFSYVLSQYSAPPPEDEPDYPFNSPTRCGWEKCLCYAHKPAHPMKLCKGCWDVAYCGDKCRER